MRRFTTPLAAPLVASLLAACGGPGDPPGPPRLAYEMPVPPSAVYVQGDTSAVSVDAGGQMIDVTVAASLTLAMDFASTPDGGVRVTTTFRDLHATASNPMGPPQEVSESAIDGELVFTLSPTGDGTVISAPELGDEVRGFVSPAVIAATFFPRLPGTAVVAGDTWTDTITVDADEAETSIESTSIVSYTAAGDTTVMGERYLFVRFTGEDDRLVEGNQMGMSMSQELAGTSEGWFLWDPVRRLPVEILIESDADGTMEVSAAPFPLSIRADNTSHVVLQRTEDGA